MSDLTTTLTPADIHQQLVALEDRAPLALIDDAAAHGDAMLDTLRQAIANEEAWENASNGAWWMQLHAAMILGRIPTEQAGLLLANLLVALDESDDIDMQSWLDNLWPALFANKPRVIFEKLNAIADNRNLDWTTRSEAQNAVLNAALNESPEALDTALDRVAARLANPNDDAEFRDISAATLLGFPRQRHRALLESFATDGADDDKTSVMATAFFDPADIEEAYAAACDTPEWQNAESPWAFYDPAAIAERQQQQQEAEARAAAIATLAAAHKTLPTPDTYTRTAPKVGRNDPCPCGSGKKYKKCCLARDEAAGHAG